MKDNAEILVNSPEAHVDILMEEYQQAGVTPIGAFDMSFSEDTRRMIWEGQSPDGRKWDELMTDGQPAMPWNGSSDTRVPVVDGVVNDAVDLLTAAFRKAELRATTVNSDQMQVSAGVSAYLHWLVHTRHKKALRLEAELAAQYTNEYGFAVAYIGWEREVGKRRVEFKLGMLQQLAAQSPPDSPMSQLPGMLMDPELDEASAAALQSLYRVYVLQAMAAGGFYEAEMTDTGLMELKPAAARKYVRALREAGVAEVVMPYIARNDPLVRVCKPYQEILAASGTMMLQQARAIFWRRWMTAAELESKQLDGWDETWIAAAKETRGDTSAWAVGSGPATKTVGGITFTKTNETNNPLIEVVYAYVKKVDEEGVTGVYETIFSPHVTHDPETHAPDFCAKHELLGYAHGQYPFVELKRENIGRGLTDTRSVSEIAGTWQNEEKKQRDTLFNRADWDTLPPVLVPSLGGVDLKLGPGGQVPLSRGKEIKALNLGAPAPSLALELVQLLKLQTADYFGQFHAGVHPAKLAIHQEKMGDDFYTFWGEVLLHVFALTLQYNPQQIVAVTGNQALAGLDPFSIMDQMMLGLEFDLKDLNPDYLLQKLEIIHGKILPADVTGAIDRAGLTAYEARAVDPRLAQRFIQDGRTASQKIFEEVQKNVANAMLGFEPQYGDSSNDPTSPMKLQFLQQLMGSNPKCQQWMQQDERFKALLENYVKNLQMGVDQQQNKQIGRLGVKPMGPGA